MFFVYLCNKKAKKGVAIDTDNGIAIYGVIIYFSFIFRINQNESQFLPKLAQCLLICIPKASLAQYGIPNNQHSYP